MYLCHSQVQNVNFFGRHFETGKDKNNIKAKMQVYKGLYNDKVHDPCYTLIIMGFDQSH